MKSGYIILEGNIGAGKTTLAKAITKAFKDAGFPAQYLPEPDESNNTFLKLYYEDPKRYALTMQEHLLHKRYAATQYAQWGALSERGWFIMDRSYFGDLCFAKVQQKNGFFAPNEFDSYVAAHKNMQTNIQFPSLAIFLHCSPEVCQARISKRISEKVGRACESGISKEYLIDLQTEIDKLEAFMRNQCRTRRINWDDNKTQEDIEQMARLIANEAVNRPKTEHDFYNPWGACSQNLFDFKEQYTLKSFAARETL